MRWSPSKELLVRGSYGGGFRAPTLADIHLPRFFSNTPGAFSDPIRCPGSAPIGGFVNEGLECDAQFQNQQGGNATLTPEKSRQWTLGVIFEPNTTTSLGFDLFSIHRRNSLGFVGDARIFDELGAADPLTAGGYFVRQVRLGNGSCAGDLPGAPTPGGTPCAINYVVMVQENLGKFTVTGVDVSASTRIGPVSLRAEGTYIARYRFQFAIDGRYDDNVGRYTTENGPIPRWRHNIQATWRAGPLGVTLGQNFVLGYRDQGGGRRVASYETYDAQAMWEGWRGLGVTLGIKNILDRDPPSSAQDQTFQVGYEPRIGDPHGRTFYAGLRYKFR